MAKTCNHAHSHSNQADRWTNFSALAEGATSFISDAYWMASIIDTTSGLNPEVMGLSYYGIAFGGVMALLSASGAAYCHRILNKIHQKTEDQTADNDALLINMTDEEVESLIAPNKRSLTLMEKYALVGDFISHTGDIAGPMTFVSTLAAPNLSRWVKTGIQAGATLFGGFASVAGVRTCKNAIETDHSVEASEPYEHSHSHNCGHSHH